MSLTERELSCDREGKCKEGIDIATVKYYLSFWEQLSVSERKQAIAYLYDTKKYGIYYELIGSQLDNQELRKKACQIYAFSHKKISFCMKEFVELYY